MLHEVRLSNLYGGTDKCYSKLTLEPLLRRVLVNSQTNPHTYMASQTMCSLVYNHFLRACTSIP